MGKEGHISKGDLNQIQGWALVVGARKAIDTS